MSEAEKIKERYKQREKIPKNRYSSFNKGNLFLIQERERKILESLNKHGMDSLTDKKILEIGCGSGGILRNFIQWGASPENLYGIDLLGVRIDTAKKINPNISFACGDAEKINFPDKSFDMVLQFTCFTSIFNSRIKKNIAEEMLRAVKDDGMILWYDFKYNNPKNSDVRGIKKKEIKSLFPNCCYNFNSITLAPPIVRKLAPVSWLGCYLLTKLKLLNSHYLVTIKKQ